VDGNVGVVHIDGDYLSTFLPAVGNTVFAATPAGIFANADGLGAPGIIDAILIGGDFAPGGLGSVVSVGGRGGNVRFVDIGGSVTHVSGGFRSEFGPFVFEPGQSVSIVDDSGALIRISPGFVEGAVDEFLFGITPIPDPTIPPVDESGVLTLKLVPVLDLTFAEYSGSIDRREIGYAIASIVSTDGVRIRSTGGPVEIGLLEVAGVNDSSVILSGKYPISVLRVLIGVPEDDTADQGDPADDAPDEGVPQAEIAGITRIVNRTGGDFVSLVIGDTSDARNVTVEAADAEDTGLTAFTVSIIFDAAIDDQPVELVQVNGHLGYTVSHTGQIVEGTLIDEDAQAGDGGFARVLSDPGGLQRSGLFSSISVTRIAVGGRLGDTDIRGDVGSIVINRDKSRGIGQFDGVAGAITIYGNLGSIDLGDGIPSPGTGVFAETGVFVFGTLDRVTISGAGRDIGGPVFASAEIGSVRVKNGARITGYNHVFGPGERVRGALYKSPTLATTFFHNDFFLEDTFVAATAPIGQISVTGQDSEIRGASIFATAIGTIKVANKAKGIFDSRIYAVGTGGDEGFIGRITVGGAGIHHTIISVDRDLGRLIVQPGGTISDSEIRGGFTIGKIVVDEIIRTDIDAINKLSDVTARHGIFDLVIEAGELGKLKAKGDILGSALFVAGPVGQVMTHGDFISTI
ncbi:MAG: hypothetical protein IID32_12800, partial [Planctomycetes bacterium]|nr:hypothetical protein [Planctomycetota bacterium]